jgi:dipeptidyl aminopeptidase/acylaminoacyl peptidase
MQADFRNHPLFLAARERTNAWLRPGTGEAVTLGQLMVAPDGSRAAAAAFVTDALDGAILRDGNSTSRIALVDLESGEIDLLTHGPRSDHAPSWSPDGAAIAFLSDREEANINRLRILDVDARIDRATPDVDGFIEYFQWSADGASILLGVAGFGSDLAGIQGAMSINVVDADRPAWTPIMEGVPEATPWRTLWLYDVAAGIARQVTPHGVNIWHGVWCGPDHVAAICSDQPEETRWYSADLRLIPLAGGAARTLFTPQDQLGRLTASPSGATVAVAEAVCSDRDIVAGDLRLIDVASGAVARPETLGADIVQLHWRGDDHLLFVADRGPETLLGLLDRADNSSRELWCGRDGRTLSGAIFPEAAPLGANPADVLFLAESFFDAPALIALENGREREIRSFATPDLDAAVRPLGSASDYSWTAPDGLTIHGWLVTPPGPGPHPVVMQVHGGPVIYTRPMYVGRLAFMQLVLSQGYALFQPNPRGSGGRGQAFARHVFGDMGGADTHDYLSGLDALTEAGIIDPARIGVTGGSYGGYMTSWLITQDQRFAAAVPAAPSVNWVSDRLTSNIPDFVDMFLADRIENFGGRYFTRSPVYYANRVKTPTLNICGALDKITHPAQALEFHRALHMEGVESVLLTYPQDGHGVRTMPAVFDYVARMMAWFDKHMPASRGAAA